MMAMPLPVAANARAPEPQDPVGVVQRLLVPLLNVSQRATHTRAISL